MTKHMDKTRPLVRGLYKAKTRAGTGPQPPSAGLCGCCFEPKLSFMDTPSSELRDFILFCAQRRSAEWPMIYDEMARVAGQRLFRGLGYSELRQMGLSLSLSGMDKTIQLVKQVTSGDDRQAADSLQGFPATSGPHPGSKQSVRVTSGKQ